MPRGGNVRVRFTADTSGLSRGALVAQKDLGRLGASGQKSLDRLRVAALTAGTAAAGGLFLGLKKSVEAAAEAEAAQARLQTQLKALGFSYQAHAKEIDNVIQKQSQLAGLDDEDLSDSFVNIVRVTKNVNEALKLNALASDLARAKGIEVAKAGQLVAKAYDGNVGALKRYGVTIEPVTAAQDRLRESHKKATVEQKRAAVESDKQATAQRALAEAQKAFAGQAEAYGKTTKGATDRLKVSLENLGETIGKAVAPKLAEIANKAADFVNEMQSGEGAGGRFAAKLKEVGDKLAPIVKFLADHPKLIAGAVAAWAAYKTASILALTAIKVQTFRKAFGLGKAVAVREGAIAGGAYATAFDAAAGAGMAKASKSGKAITAVKALGRAWGPLAAATFWLAFADAVGDKDPSHVTDTANPGQRGVTRGPRRGGRGGPTEPRNQSGPGNSNIPDFKAFAGVSKQQPTNMAGGGRSFMATASATSGRTYSQPELARLWVSAGGNRGSADIASAVAMAESGGRSDATNHNTDGSIDRGLWQINSVHGALSTFDPMGNARAAVKISGNGSNWSPWVAYTNGNYKRFLGGSGNAGQNAPAGTSAPSSNQTPAQKRRAEARARARERAREDRRFETPGTAENLEAGIAQSDVQIAQGNVRQGVTTRVNAIKDRIARIRRALKGHLRPATRARLRSELAQLTTELAGLENPSRTLGPVTATEPSELGPSQEDFANAAIAEARLTPGTEDDVSAMQGLLGIRQGELDAARASGDPRRISSAIDAFISVRDALAELKDSIDQAAELQRQRDAINVEIRDNQLRLLALADQGKLIEASVGAMVNGWIGERLGPKFGLPGAPGTVAAYGGQL